MFKKITLGVTLGLSLFTFNTCGSDVDTTWDGHVDQALELLEDENFSGATFEIEKAIKLASEGGAKDKELLKLKDIYMKSVVGELSGKIEDYEANFKFFKKTEYDRFKRELSETVVESIHDDIKIHIDHSPVLDRGEKAELHEFSLQHRSDYIKSKYINIINEAVENGGNLLEVQELVDRERNLTKEDKKVVYDELDLHL